MTAAKALVFPSPLAADHLQANPGWAEVIFVLREALKIVGWLLNRRKQEAIIERRIDKARSDAFWNGMIVGGLVVLGLVVLWLYLASVNPIKLKDPTIVSSA